MAIVPSLLGLNVARFATTAAYPGSVAILWCGTSNAVDVQVVNAVAVLRLDLTLLGMAVTTFVVGVSVLLATVPCTANAGAGLVTSDGVWATAAEVIGICVVASLSNSGDELSHGHFDVELHNVGDGVKLHVHCVVG